MGQEETPMMDRDSERNFCEVLQETIGQAAIQEGLMPPLHWVLLDGGRMMYGSCLVSDDQLRCEVLVTRDGIGGSPGTAILLMVDSFGDHRLTNIGPVGN